MNDKFELYKKLASDALDKLNEVLALTNEQYRLVSNENTDPLTKLTEKRGRIITEFNLICEEMNKILAELGDNETVLDFDNVHKENVKKFKNNIYDANKKLEDAISYEMEKCRNDIKGIVENKEALNGYGHLDYPMTSAYFDKRNC